MSLFRRAALSTMAAGWAAAGWACSEGGGPPGDPGDAAAPSEVSAEAGVDGEAPKLSLDALDLLTYVAQPTPLQAFVQTNAPNASVEWSLASSPAGSALASGPLTVDGGSAVFVADVAGAYTLRVRASAGGLELSKNVSLTAVEAPLFFATYNGVNEGTATLESIGTNGTGRVALTCELPSGSFATRSALGLWAGRGADWIEAPAGTASRVAAVVALPADGGGTDQALTATTSASRCDAGGLVELDRVPNGTTNLQLRQPRLSPDSKRVAYFRRGPPKEIVTASLDGQGKPRIVGSVPNEVDTRPEWVDPTHVAWIQTPGDGTWRVVVAPDEEQATTDLYLKCPGLAPRELEFLADGSVIVSLPTGDGGVDRELVIYARDADRVCVERRRWALNLEADGTSWSGGPIRAALAHDFALSPDRTQVAYLKDEGDAPLGAIYVADVKGARPPRRVSSAYPRGINGPRWVAGGGLLTWSVQIAVVDAGDPDSGSDRVRHGVAIAPVYGGTDRLLFDELDGAAGDGSVVVGVGNRSSNVGYYGCASAGRTGSDPSARWPTFAALAAVALLRRRSRSRQT